VPISSVGIVGGGRCGLLVGRALAERVPTTVLIERLPAPGGQEPERPEVERLADLAERAGLRLMLGTAAVTWDGKSLETLGVDGAVRLGLDAIVIATGARPATRAELGIAGDRGAGILPGSAALHMIEAGVLPGRRPLVLGGGSLASSLVAALKHAGAEEVTVVAPHGVLDESVREADRIFSEWTVSEVEGLPRINSATLVSVGNNPFEQLDGYRIATDALLLAHARTPMRNVEGAISPGPSVSFCQSEGDPKLLSEAEAIAAQAVSALGFGDPIRSKEVQV
jgi:NADPH-dependent 2,4-dienoyl-CoA reductase/sulfur reductase-like enzyme